MTLSEVIDSVRLIGEVTGTADRAAAVIAECRDRLAAIAAKLDGVVERPTLLLEWTDPAFTDGHWVPEMIAAAGGRSVMGRPGHNSQGATWDEITSCGAEVVIVAPCGFRLAGAAELTEQVVARGVLPDAAEVWAVDADAFVVRPSPRVVDGVEIFASILHPDRHGAPDAAAATRVR
jgi:iron complex transport system substrate-binding protein